MNIHIEFSYIMPIEEREPVDSGDHDVIQKSASLPDVYLLNFTNVAGATLPPGTTLEYSFALANIGDAPTPATIPLSLYLDNNLMGTTNLNLGSVDAGYFVRVGISFSIPAAGRHTIRLHANPNSTFAESNYINNTVSGTWTYIASGQTVDLEATRLTCDAALPGGSFYTNQKVTFFMTASNFSTKAVTVPIYLLYNNTVSASEQITLSASSQTNLSVQTTFMNPGSLTVLFAVDPNNTSGDWNMTNNEITARYTVVANPNTQRVQRSETSLYTSLATMSSTTGAAAVPVAVRPTINMYVDYHISAGKVMIEEVGHSTMYEANKYSPEVCTYSCSVGKIEIIKETNIESISPIEMERADMLYPAGYHAIGLFKKYDWNQKSVLTPFSIKSYHSCIWSNNCVPIASTHSLEMVIENV